jgi:hypothetical protein
MCVTIINAIRNLLGCCGLDSTAASPADYKESVKEHPVTHVFKASVLEQKHYRSSPVRDRKITKKPSTATDDSSKESKKGEGTRDTTTPSLEATFEHLICTNVDITLKSGFKDYLDPNELIDQPLGRDASYSSPDCKDIPLKDHLSTMRKGYAVSVGTERSFFLLALADPHLCDGLVVRDINPKVKAYVDFNVLLLRISSSREEYCSLAKRPSIDDYSKRLEIILAKITTTGDLPGNLKEYYRKNLENFAKVYYCQSSKEWAEKDSYLYEKFYSVHYYEDDGLFTKLQRYAKQGRIISSVGSINDLSSFHDLPISLIDTSNVSAYEFLDIHGCAFDVPVTIIYTLGTGWVGTTFYSIQYSPLNDGERREFEELLHRLKSTNPEGDEKGFVVTFANTLGSNLDHSSHLCACYTKEVLGRIRAYCHNNLYQLPDGRFIDMKDGGKILAALSPDTIEKLVHDSSFARFVSRVVNASLEFLISKAYVLFMDLPLWREEYEEKIKKNLQYNEVWVRNEFELFKEHGTLQLFITQFGRDRISTTWPLSAQKLLQEVESASPLAAYFANQH